MKESNGIPAIFIPWQVVRNISFLKGCNFNFSLPVYWIDLQTLSEENVPVVVVGRDTEIQLFMKECMNPDSGLLEYVYFGPDCHRSNAVSTYYFRKEGEQVCYYPFTRNFSQN